MEKRGLSGVITAILIIAIGIVALVTVFNLILPMVRERVLEV